MKFILVAMIVVAHLAIGDAIKCYKCSYPPSSECGAEFDKVGAREMSKECDSLFTSCAKFVTGPNITRDCGENLDDLEGSIPDERDDYFCESDLCNGASSIDLALATIMVLVPALVLGS